MNGLVLDTHAWIWYITNPARFVYVRAPDDWWSGIRTTALFRAVDLR
ncbi:MAG: hypothetical protein JO323_05120 [Acidobacteriia bacterium]|nr:hypothetical protein [Terriglobia bacterium]